MPVLFTGSVYRVLQLIVVPTVYGKKPLPFNETERNGTERAGPFNETERAVHDPFFIRSRSVRICRPF